MRDFRKYRVWELGHNLTLDIYKRTNDFPKEEIYGLISQMRRASYSIPSNIAEGCGRESQPDFKRFL
ncbi:MAG: four helix bundle protein, partial [Flavobacteriaceae bacterium]